MGTAKSQRLKGNIKAVVFAIMAIPIFLCYTIFCIKSFRQYVFLLLSATPGHHMLGELTTGSFFTYTDIRRRGPKNGTR